MDTNVGWRRFGWWVALGLVILLGLRPYLSAWGSLPLSNDAVDWAGGSTPDAAGLRWAFAQQQFVGYRPMMASTFILDNTISLFDPRAYWTTDLLLGAGCGVVLYLLARRWLGGSPGWSLLTVAVYFSHPATAEILSDTSKRSYSLGMIFGLGALLAIERAGRGWWVVAAVSAALGLLSNEVTVVIIGLLPLVLWMRTEEGKTRYLRLLPTAIVVGAALAVRTAVLGSLGGYPDRILQVPWDGRVGFLRDLTRLEATGAAFGVSWFYPFVPVPQGGVTSIGPGFWAAIVAMAMFYFWRIGVDLFWRRDRDPTPRLAAAWFVAYTLFYGLSAVWFWRMGHPMLTPWCLLLVWVLRDTIVRKRWLELLPQGLMLAAFLASAPTIFGMNGGMQRTIAARDRFVARVEADVAAVERPAVVFLVVPQDRDRAATLRAWLNLRADRDLRFVLVAVARRHGDEDEPLVAAVTSDAVPALRLAPAAKFTLAWQGLLAQGALPLWRLRPKEGEHRYLYWLEGEDGVLMPIR